MYSDNSNWISLHILYVNTNFRNIILNDFISNFQSYTLNLCWFYGDIYVKKNEKILPALEIGLKTLNDVTKELELFDFWIKTLKKKNIISHAEFNHIPWLLDPTIFPGNYIPQSYPKLLSIDSYNAIKMLNSIEHPIKENVVISLLKREISSNFSTFDFAKEERRNALKWYQNWISSNMKHMTERPRQTYKEDNKEIGLIPMVNFEPIEKIPKHSFEKKRKILSEKVHSEFQEYLQNGSKDEAHKRKTEKLLQFYKSHFFARLSHIQFIRILGLNKKKSNSLELELIQSLIDESIMKMPPP